MGQGGADRVTLDLLRALERQQFQPSLVLMRAEGHLLDDLPPDVKLHPLRAGSLWTVWWPLARLLRRERPDILFSTSSGTNVAACLARLVSTWRGRLILSERNVLMRDQPLLRGRLLIWLKRLLYPSADCVTAVSRGVASDLVEKLGLPSAKVSVVYNPVVVPELATLAQEGPDHPWFADDIPMVLAVGRLVEAKGFSTLIEAFSKVRARTEARLLILGEGPERERLEGQIESQSLTAAVQLPGFVKNPFSYMSRCTLFVLSSRHEGLPGALIQAMACGAAVISTDCHSGPAEIITPEEDGILVPVDDPDLLAERICDLLARPRLRTRLGREAARSAQRFRLETSLTGYERNLLGTVALPVPAER